MRWIEGHYTAPAKSECGLYVIRGLASPEFHFAAYFRPSLYDMTACGEPVKTVEEAKAQAVAHLASLQSKEAA